MRTLDVGDNGRGLAKEVFPDATEVVSLDAPGTSADIQIDLESDDFLNHDLKGKYDLVFMAHVLEHLSFEKAPAVLAKLAQHLNKAGILYVKVPSLEYVAEKLITSGFDKPLMMQIYGSQENQWQYHKSAYTIPYLRGIMENNCGLSVQFARRSWTKIVFADGEAPFMENIIAGVCVDERP